VKVIHPFRTGGAGYGLERNILCTLPGLVDRGIEAVALAVTEPRSGPVSPEFAAQLDAAGVRLVTIAAEGRLPCRLARRMSEVFGDEAPDVIHSHDYKCDLAMLWAKTGDAARMTTVHGWCSRTAKERFYEWLNVRCCKRMDRVIVFCEDYRRRLTKRGVPGRIIRVVPVGLDARVVPGDGADLREAWGVPDDAVVVAQIGRLSREKGPDLFVRVAAELSETLPQARFVLVGDGLMRDKLEAQGAPVLFAGYVRHMADVLRAVDIAVNCSLTEAIPRTVLEAGSAGIPVVATRVGGIPDAVEDGVTGILCDPGDAAAVAAAITKLAEDPALRAALGAAAKERVGTVFSIAACSERLAEAYESVLKERKDRA